MRSFFVIYWNFLCRHSTNIDNEALKLGIQNTDVSVARLVRSKDGAQAYSINGDVQLSLEKPLLLKGDCLQGKAIFLKFYSLSLLLDFYHFSTHYFGVSYKKSSEFFRIETGG